MFDEGGAGTAGHSKTDVYKLEHYKYYRIQHQQLNQGISILAQIHPLAVTVFFYIHGTHSFKKLTGLNSLTSGMIPCSIKILAIRFPPVKYEQQTEQPAS